MRATAVLLLILLLVGISIMVCKAQNNYKVLFNKADSCFENIVPSGPTTTPMLSGHITTFTITESAFPKEDTFKVELLQTARSYGQSKWHLAESVIGYRIVKQNYDLTDLVYREQEPIEVRYLDKYKKPVPDSIIVWFSTKYKEHD